MSTIEKARIAYTGSSLNDGTMPVKDLAPALLAFTELVESAYRAIGGTKPVKVMLNQDSLHKGSFDITFLLNLDILQQVKLFMSTAQEIGLTDLLTVLGWGTAAGKGIFWLIKKIHGRKIKSIDAPRGEITLADGETIQTDPNTIKVFLNVDCRVSVEKVIEPVKQEGIDGFELRDPDRNNQEQTLLQIDKRETELFKAPPAADEGDIESDTAEQEMLARIISVNFDLGKWRLSDGTNSFWASIEDKDFLQKVDKGELSFRKGDMLRIRYYVHQAVKNGKLSSDYIITSVLELKRAPQQIKLDL